MPITPEIPNNVLHDIGEFSNGFFLIAITEGGQIEVYNHLSTFVQNLAVEKFMEQYIRNKDEVSLAEFMDGYFDEEEEGTKPSSSDDAHA